MQYYFVIIIIMIFDSLIICFWRLFIYLLDYLLLFAFNKTNINNSFLVFSLCYILQDIF